MDPGRDSALCCRIGGIIGLIGQCPAAPLSDAARSETAVAGLAGGDDRHQRPGLRALADFPVVALAATLHALASCVLGPAIAAIQPRLVGPLAVGERFGRNARFASLGNGSAAGR